MCHSSCATCSSDAFTSCLSCSSGLTLSQSVCYCDSTWQSQCTGESSVKQAAAFIRTALGLLTILMMVCYLIKVRLPLTYRWISGFQTTSLLIYCRLVYLQHEDQYLLKALGTANGPYYLKYRLDSLTTDHILPTMFLMCSMVIAWLTFYYPYQAFVKSYPSYLDYLKETSWDFLQNFYIFGSKMMYFYLGLYLSQPSTQILSIVILVIYSLICFGTLIRVIYSFHNGEVDSTIYPTCLYLYTIMSPMVVLGIPLASTTVLLYIIFSVPIVLLFLIVIFNPTFKIFIREHVLFYLAEFLMAAVAGITVFVDQKILTYLLICVAYLVFVAMIVEAAILYYRGHTIEELKVHPEKSGERKMEMWERKPEQQGRKHEEKSERRPDQKSQRKPEQKSERKPEEVFERKPEKIFDRMPEQTFQRKPERTFQKQPTEIFQRKPERTFQKQATEIFQNQSERTLQRSRENTFMRKPERAVIRKPEQIFQKNSENTVSRNPERTLESVPEQTYERKPENTFSRRPERTIGRKPEQTFHQRKPENTLSRKPERTMESVPEQTYERKPERTLGGKHQNTIEPKKTMERKPSIRTEVSERTAQVSERNTKVIEKENYKAPQNFMPRKDRKEPTQTMKNRDHYF